MEDYRSGADNQYDGKLYIGTSGLVLPVPNKLFYPEEFQSGSRLSYYASLYNSIEINSTFYKLPKPATVEKWAGEVPDHFRFTFKIWKEITHQKHLAYQLGDIQNFFEVVQQAEDKRGCILIQFPASIRIEQWPQLQILLLSLKEHCGPWTLAIEFRHASLYTKKIVEVINKLGFTLVMHDYHKGAKTALIGQSQTVYLRFHGPDGNYRNSYDEATLSEYASYVQEWIRDQKRVFVYFNNTLGNVNQNLSTFEKMIQENF